MADGASESSNSSSGPSQVPSNPNSFHSRSHLFFQDTLLFFKLLKYLPSLFAPLKTENELCELYFSQRNMLEVALHVVVGFFSGLLMILTIPLFFVAPVSVFLLYVALCNSLVYLFCYSLNIKAGKVKGWPSEGMQGHPTEKWIFVNGVCVGRHWLQANVSMISAIFGRPVCGVHNCSYGAVFDLLECIAQRCFLLTNKDTRSVYLYLRTKLLKEKFTKVVVIAHSQGGIILSAALDMLLAELPSECLGKLEIYTFGNAAKHFNNPLRHPSTQGGMCERQVRHVEHYCNENDFVARFGALESTCDKAMGGFAGEVFLNKGGKGHLMNQHYLEVMFRHENSSFLHQPFHPNKILESKGNSGDVEHGRGAGGEKNETMRDHSRLWRYRNGGSPS